MNKIYTFAYMIHLSRIAFFLSILALLLSCNPGDNNNPNPNPEINEGTPENIVLFIGDGMGVAQINAAQTVNDGSLNMTSLNTSGLMTTHGADRAVTESAAAVTALACGTKTNYKMLGVNAEGETVRNLFEYLHELGYATGVITTASLQDATPAGFYAHVENRDLKEEIAYQMAYSNVDILVGGGSFYLNEREDGKNLMDTMMTRGYAYYDFIDDVPDNEQGKLLVVQAQYRLPGIEEERGDFLQKAVSVAISRLDKTGKPWFLMVENEHIDLRAHDNMQDEMLAEVIDLDLAVGQTQSYATVNKETLIVVTADHECGGYSIIGGNVFEGTVIGDFQADNHTGVMVPVFAFGPGENIFTGVYDNTTLFEKFASLLNINVD